MNLVVARVGILGDFLSMIKYTENMVRNCVIKRVKIPIFVSWAINAQK